MYIVFHSEDIAIKVAVKLQSRRKTLFLGPRFVPGGIPQIFKLHLLPTMWPDMVEFRSVSLEIRGRKKMQKEESVLKP